MSDIKLEVLIAAMNLKSPEEHEQLIKRSKITTSSLLINQITKDDINVFNKEEGKDRLFSYREKGLSKSRNKAINNAIGDIGIICDDDVIYVDNYEEIIREAYEANPDADIIAFYIESTNPERPIRHLDEGEVDFEKALRLCSCRLTFKLQSFKDKELYFNEMFGAGSDFYMGEENILLSHALRKNMKIINVDKKIADVVQEESTWYGNFDKEYFIIKGACYYEITPDNYMELIYDFAERKQELYRENLTKQEAIDAMVEGVKKYKKML